MSIKKSLTDNKEFILESLPSQELKDQFIADLEKVEEPAASSIEEQVAEAQAPDHISEDMYEGIKKELESRPAVVPMSKKEEQAAIEEALKDVPSNQSE